MTLPPPDGQVNVQACHNGAKQQLPTQKSGLPGQRPDSKKAHDRLRLFERRKAKKRGKTTVADVTHGCSVCRKMEMGWQSHLILLRRKTLRRVAVVPKGLKQSKFKDSGSQNGKEVEQHPQYRHPQGQEGYGAGRGRGGHREQRRGRGDSSAFLIQLIKANIFINISVHGDSNREESGSFDEDVVSEFGIGCLQIDDTSLPSTIIHNQCVTFAEAEQCVVQGGGSTNPVNNQYLRVKNNNDTAKTCEALPDPTSAGTESTIPLYMGGKKPVLAELHTYRFTLDNWKCYLDICATYHTFFVR